MTRELPRTLEQALDPAWLTEALAPVSGGARVTEVEKVEVLRTMATKVRFKARYEDGATGSYCLKAFLDMEAADGNRANTASVRESDFYNVIAPKVSVRVPECVTAPVDREAQFGVVIMQDLIVRGGHFCTALEPFDAARAKKSLEQLARLHTSHSIFGAEALSWAPRQITWLAEANIIPPDVLQGMMNDARSEGLPARARDAELLLKGLKALAAVDADRPPSLIHGDCHAGNIFETSEGTGLIDWQLLQQGGWALDVAYHIAAILTVEMAEREERALVSHYLETVRSLGGTTPDAEKAWLQYRMAPVYGFFLWSITRKVDRPIINAFCNRLGSSVIRHDSFGLLGL